MLFNISEIIPEKDPAQDLFAEKKRKAWKSIHSAQARCDFAPDRYRLNSRGILFLSLWKASIYGMTLSDIKADSSMPEFFAENISNFISHFLHFSKNSDSSGISDWAIVTPPPRRHLEGNFAESVALGISKRLGIPFIRGVAECRNRQRVNAEFSLLKTPEQNNLIIFDDIVTTGSTFIAMNKILEPLNKTLFYVTAINNKL